MKAQVTGEQRTIKLLERFDRDAYKEIAKGFRKAGEKVRDEARLQTPSGNALSNWGRWVAVAHMQGLRSGICLQVGARSLGNAQHG